MGGGLPGRGGICGVCPGARASDNNYHDNYACARGVGKRYNVRCVSLSKIS